MTPANSHTGTRVEEILARGITIQWAEAVALVLGACRQLLVTGASGFPTAAQIVLYAEGTVVVLATADQPQVRAAGLLLGSLLGDDVPVRLRLLAGATVAYGSLQEFSEALSYFERPDAVDLLRELHRRAAAAPPRTASTVAPAPLPVAPPEAPAPAKATKVRRWLVVTAAAALVCLMAWFVGSRLGGIRAMAAVAPEAAGDASAVSPSAAAEGSTERQPKPSDTNGPAIPHTSSGSISSSAKAAGGMDVSSTLDLSDRDLGVVGPTVEPLEPAPGTFPPVGYGYRDASPDAVYSKDDPEVIPPQSVYPKLPSDRSGSSAPGRTILELLISADGFVERVRLRTAPRDIHEFMLVSAAKAWRFDPATVNGRPVRFLYTVAITRPN